ncbi:MAG TPA: DNA phosphorothioation-dependent restriction protein DptH [Gammaproteobacteria bacterium]|nr:DNA phosphorothioation-dependent restriction protein DptH [Gammaproteobacteria bacterium]
MFEQSFKYIAGILLRHFLSVPPRAGERFHIHAEKNDEVKALYNALCEGTKIRFTCGKYISRAIRFGKINLLLASSHDATEGFLTRLRNNTASQKNSFAGVALLTIHDTSLDSIIGGSQSLNKEGGPLHITSFKRALERDIEGLKIHSSEKKALRAKLDIFNTTIHEDHNAILAYYPFMNVLQHGVIKNTDWNDLGLFPDPEIQTVGTEKNIRNRILDNQALFLKVQNIHKYGNPADDLVKDFIHAGVKELKKPTWEQLSYGQVKKWQEDRSKASPPTYIEDNYLFPIDGLEYWERAEGTTPAAKRKRHIIIFNPAHHDSVEYTLSFDKAVKQSAIIVAAKSKISAEQQGKKIKLTVKECGQNAVIDQVIYNDKNASGKYIFNIAVLPFPPATLANHKSTYLVKGQPRSQRIRFNAESVIIFNDNGTDEARITISEDSQIPISPETKVVAELAGDLDFSTLEFDIIWEGSKIPCELAIDASKPVYISGVKIWKYKRESKKSFNYANDNKLVFGNEDFYTNRQRTLHFLNQEQQIISEFPQYCHWVQNKNGIKPLYLDIDKKILESFTSLTNFYNKRNLLPSLTSTFETELLDLMQAYVQTFAESLSNIPQGQPLDKKTHNLLKVGTVEELDGQRQVCFTPLHPLNVAYQLKVHSELVDEKIPEEILGCLSASDLLPYINGSSEPSDKLCPVLETELPEWTVYRPFRTIHRGWHNEYVHKLIAEKISEYESHFPYLFTGSTEAPVKINLINLGNCIDALNGVIRYFQREIDSKEGDASKINPLSIRIYDEQSGVNKFEEFALYSSPERIHQDFSISLKTKSLDDHDVLKVIREKLDFYIKPKNEEPEYAHLTFFKFAQESIQWTYHDIAAVTSGCSLQGLVNAVPSVFSVDEYITGFGAKYAKNNQDSLLDFATRFNAFARVANTQNPYSPNEATFATLQGIEKERLNSIYDKSNWVTFIDPKVDLNFFKLHKDTKDLIIIHYSDQYNNTSGYDAITVTRKSKQYRAILREYLNSKNISSQTEDELKLINMFNAINGDWLLRLISSRRGHFSREKISILSAVNTMLAVLKHPDMVWVPLSLEEILRVSGSIGLKKSDGLFSAKNLGSLGVHCDDLLMAGVELRDQVVQVYLYPVEVKIGGDQTKKAKEQSIHTSKVLKEHLSLDTFKAKFYRNFFAKLIVVAAEKMALYDLVKESDVALIINQCREHLLNDEFTLNWNLGELGHAAVLSFKAEQFSRKIYREDDCLFVEMLENDGYANMLEEPQSLFDIYNDSESTVNNALLLANCHEKKQNHNNQGPSNPESSVNPLPQTEETKTKDTFSTNVNSTDSEKHDDSKDKPVQQGMKILFGHEINNSVPIYWEPNNTNKVMHTNTGIIGTMGTGKTQFTKSLVTQLVWESKNNVKSTKLGFLIFDYKGDYIKDDFLQATGARRFDLHHLPFNPLALTVGSNVQPMLPLHTANAIKESISTAFGLGVVQKQKLRDCIMAAYSTFGIDKANKETWKRPAPTLANVCEEYLNSEDVKNDSLYAALDNLYQFEIFEPDATKTISLWNLLDDVIVINLSGYDQDIQNLVVAITLDQFYSQMQKAGHSFIDGDYREITKMVLVDEADNFLSQDFQAIRKILKEGREFGVGTILSTQFLNHFSTGDNEFANYILTWVAHRVSEIKNKDIATLFGKQSKEMINQLMTEISGLEKHVSLCNIGDGIPVKLKDKAFWQLIDRCNDAEEVEQSIQR